VKTYRLIPEAFEQERVRLARGFYAAYFISLFAALILVAGRNMNFKPGTSLLVTILGFTLAVVFTICVAFWAMFRSLRLRRQEWQSYQLDLDGERLTRRTTGGKDVVISRSEITGFDETAGRGFFVKTRDMHRFIYVPSAVEGYEELKRELGMWRPFPPARKREPIWRSPFFIGAVCLLAWWVLWFSAARQYVLGAAFVLLVFLFSTFLAVVRSPRSTISMKRMSWIYLLVAVLALIRVATVMRISE
jgi:hypothetical protein